MLKKILDGKTCAECKICCGFDNTDLWEMPVMTKESKEKLLEYDPNVKFIEKDGGYVVDAGKLDNEELFFCPALDHKKGCVLGEEKPFDCQIWPFRIMRSEDGKNLYITISPVCPELYNRPISQISEFVTDDLKGKIIKYAEIHQEIIKRYIENYPILWTNQGKIYLNIQEK